MKILRLSLKMILFILSLKLPLDSCLNAQNRVLAPNDLTNALRRSTSIQSLMQERWQSLYSNQEKANRFRLGIFSEGNLFSGFTLESGFGNRSGLLARTYGDFYFSFPINKSELRFATAGYRYGVIFDDILLSVPSADPYGRGITTNDLSGDQIYDDIYRVSFWNPSFGEITLDVVQNRVKEAATGVATSTKSVGLSYAISGNFSRILFYNFFLASENADSRFPSYSVNVDFIKAFSSISNNYDAFQKVYSLFGVVSRYIPSLEENLFLLDFSLSTYFGNPRESYFFLKGLVNFYTPTKGLKDGKLLNLGQFDFDWQSVPNLFNGAFIFGFSGSSSFFDDPRLKNYSSSDNVIGFRFDVRMQINSFIGGELRLGYSRNHTSTLQYIIESVNTNTFHASISLGIGEKNENYSDRINDVEEAPQFQQIRNGSKNEGISRAQNPLYQEQKKEKSELKLEMFQPEVTNGSGEMVVLWKEDKTLINTNSGSYERGVIIEAPKTIEWRMQNNYSIFQTTLGIFLEKNNRNCKNGVIIKIYTNDSYQRIEDKWVEVSPKGGIKLKQKSPDVPFQCNVLRALWLRIVVLKDGKSNCLKVFIANPTLKNN